jgi:hypothetical protein
MIFLSSIVCLSRSGGCQSGRCQIYSWSVAKEKHAPSKVIMIYQPWCLIERSSRSNWFERPVAWPFWVSVSSWGTQWRSFTANLRQFVQCQWTMVFGMHVSFANFLTQENGCLSSPFRIASSIMAIEGSSEGSEEIAGKWCCRGYLMFVEDACLCTKYGNKLIMDVSSRNFFPSEEQADWWLIHWTAREDSAPYLILARKASIFLKVWTTLRNTIESIIDKNVLRANCWIQFGAEFKVSANANLEWDTL